MSNEFIKRADETSEYTPELIQELMKCSKDPIHFIRNYVYLQHPVKGRMLFDMYDYQEELVRACQNNDRIILLAARQLGKTQTISIYLLWFAMFHDDKTVVIASKDDSHSMEILERIRYAYEEMPKWLKAGVRYYNKHEIAFTNGSRVISKATSEKTGRGLSISILYLDELAFVSHRVQTAMWRSLAPTLSTGGAAIISSTPNGDTDLFATLWRGANAKKNNFHPMYFPWTVHPERGEDYLEKMRGELGEIGLRQEVLCLAGKTSINTSIGTLTMEELYEHLSKRKI